MANTQVVTVGQGAERAKLWGAFIFVILGLAAFYVLHAQSEWVRWLALVVGLAIATVIFFLSDAGRRLWAFAHDAVREMRKVVWPSRKEAIQLTAYVFAFVVVMALVLWLADKTLEWAFYDLILGWKK